MNNTIYAEPPTLETKPITISIIDDIDDNLIKVKELIGILTQKSLPILTPERSRENCKNTECDSPVDSPINESLRCTLSKVKEVQESLNEVIERVDL